MIGRLDDALALQREAIDLYEYQCSDKPYLAWRAKRRLAQILETASEITQAQDILAQMYANFEGEYGQNDLDTLTTRRLLAWNAHVRGCEEESLALYQELLVQMRSKYEPDEHLFLQTAWDEVRVQHAAGYTAEALKHLQALIPILCCSYGEESPKVADARALIDSMAGTVPSDVV